MNTAIREGPKTMSARHAIDGSGRTFLRNRRPLRWSADRAASSGRVFVERLPCMTARTTGDEGLGGGGNFTEELGPATQCANPSRHRFGTGVGIAGYPSRTARGATGVSG